MKGMFWFIAVVIMGFSCKKESSTNERIIKEYAFESGTDGWEAGFADYPYPLADETIYEFDSGYAALPDGLNNNAKGLKIGGHNRSDDLFMFWRKRVANLGPNQRYAVTIEVEMASQYPENSVGIGGSPGSSVFMKAGAAIIKPTTKIDDSQWLRMNIDKDNQSGGGQDMQVLGNIGIPGDAYKHQIIRRNNTGKVFEVTADSTGSLWLIVGTDSGYEGLTIIYYDRIMYTFTPV